MKEPTSSISTKTTFSTVLCLKASRTAPPSPPPMINTYLDNSKINKTKNIRLMLINRGEVT